MSIQQAARCRSRIGIRHRCASRSTGYHRSNHYATTQHLITRFVERFVSPLQGNRIRIQTIGIQWRCNRSGCQVSRLQRNRNWRGDTHRRATGLCNPGNAEVSGAHVVGVGIPFLRCGIHIPGRVGGQYNSRESCSTNTRNGVAGFVEGKVGPAQCHVSCFCVWHSSNQNSIQRSRCQRYRDRRCNGPGQHRC